MLERDSRDTDDQALLEAPRSESATVCGRAEPYGPAADEANRLRSPARREQSFEAEEDREPQQRSAGSENRQNWLRHAITVAFGLLCLLLALPAGYLYWDYTSHFEYTDDSYIAARQFAIAPEVSGYITAVPVTDNEHVNAGDVIARIDDRTYRAALAQARAQVAAHGPILRTSMHSWLCSRPRSAPTRHRWTRHRRPWCLHSSRRRGINTWQRQSRAPFRTPRITPRSCNNSKPRWTARRRRSNWRSGRSMR